MAKPIQSIAKLTEAYEQLRATANLVSPVTAVSTMPPMSQVSLRQVLVDPTVPTKSNGEPMAGTGPDVYFDPRFCRGNERALGKNAILKILAAAGVSIADTRRTDPRNIANYWEWTVALELLDYDGQPRRVSATKEVDLRDGSPDAVKPERKCRKHNTTDLSRCNWNDGCRFDKTGRTTSLEAAALAEKRKHGAANAETKALLRAARELLTLPHKMSLEQLRKPFVVPALVPLLDPSDPDVKAALIERAVGGRRTLYGSGVSPHGSIDPARSVHVSGSLSPGGEPDDPGDVLEPEVVPPTPTPPRAEAEPAPAPPASPPRAVPAPSSDDEPPPPGDLDEPPPQYSKSDPAGARQPSQAEHNPPQHDDAYELPAEAAPAAPGRGGCDCPCKCAAQVKPAQAEASKKRTGAARCPRCFPGPQFDADRHANLGDLKLPKLPGTTAARVAEWNKKRAAKGGAS
jgi:hypothetical protein